MLHKYDTGAPVSSPARLYRVSVLVGVNETLLKGLKMDLERFETGLLTENKAPRDLTNPQIAHAIKLSNSAHEPVVCWYDSDERRVRFMLLSDYDTDEGQAFVEPNDIIAIVG